MESCVRPPKKKEQTKAEINLMLHGGSGQSHPPSFSARLSPLYAFLKRNHQTSNKRYQQIWTSQMHSRIVTHTETIREKRIKFHVQGFLNSHWVPILTNDFDVLMEAFSSTKYNFLTIEKMNSQVRPNFDSYLNRTLYALLQQKIDLDKKKEFMSLNF